MRAHEGIEKVRENPCNFHKKLYNVFVFGW